jgi:hypothetical protein
LLSGYFQPAAAPDMFRRRGHCDFEHDELVIPMKDLESPSVIAEAGSLVEPPEASRKS